MFALRRGSSTWSEAEITGLLDHLVGALLK
jgi:hypothetical protein